MLCNNCGHKIPNMSRFCPECGIELTKDKTFTNTINKKLDTLIYKKQCINCNSEIPGDSKFCPECACEQPQKDVVSSIKTLMDEIKERPELQKKYKILAAFVSGALALCIIIAILSVVIKPTINLNKYITITTTGYDTVGEAEIEFDYEKFAEDYIGKLSWLDIRDYVRWDVNETSNLSNGDVVELSWDCGDFVVLDKFDYKLKYSTIEYKVSGLEEAETFDPFEGIEVVFEGISGEGKVYTTGEPANEVAQNFSFYFDKDHYLANGDSVILYASYGYTSDISKKCLEEYGKMPSITEKTFAVEGLNTYLMSLNELSESDLNLMQSQATDTYNAYVARDWGEGELSDFSYVGSYLLTAKNTENANKKNALYLVYKATVNNSYTYDDSTYNENNEIYWYITYNNLIISTDGDLIIDITSYSTPNATVSIDSGISTGWYSTKKWKYYGYDSLESLYKNNITVNIDKYKCEEKIMN